MCSKTWGAIWKPVVANGWNVMWQLVVTTRLICWFMCHVRIKICNMWCISMTHFILLLMYAAFFLSDFYFILLSFCAAHQRDQSEHRAFPCSTCRHAAISLPLRLFRLQLALMKIDSSLFCHVAAMRAPTKRPTQAAPWTRMWVCGRCGHGTGNPRPSLYYLPRRDKQTWQEIFLSYQNAMLGGPLHRVWWEWRGCAAYVILPKNVFDQFLVPGTPSVPKYKHS
jgi:hypothetical protein